MQRYKGNVARPSTYYYGEEAAAQIPRLLCQSSLRLLVRMFPQDIKWETRTQQKSLHLLDRMFPPRYNGETGTQKQLCGILFLSLNSLTVSLIVAVELNRRYMWMSGFCMDCRLHPIVDHHVPIRGGRVEALLQSDPPGENRS